jgi:hypothetical protein
MTTAVLERPKTKQQLNAYVPPEYEQGQDGEGRNQRIAESTRIQDALVARIKAAPDEATLRALVIEMEAMPIQTLHHMAKLNIRDAWRARLSEFYPPL